jgi:hypothetical protein
MGQNRVAEIAGLILDNNQTRINNAREFPPVQAVPLCHPILLLKSFNNNAAMNN